MSLIKGYDHFGGISPESAPLTNVLHALGANYPEAVVFGLGGGIGASYFVFEYKGMVPNVFLGMRYGLYGSPDFFANACRRLGATPVFKESASPGAAQKHLLETLAAGKPTVAYVCGKEAYSYHHVGVAGLDGESVLLDDMEPAPVSMSLEQFAKRRSAIGQFKNRLLTVTLPSALPSWKPGFLEAIGSTINGMHEAHMKSFASNFGLASLEKFARLLGDAKDKKGWAKQFPPGPKLESGLKWIQLYTRNGAHRGTYADFLEEGGKLTKLKGLGESIKLYRKLDRQWQALAAMANPASPASLSDLSQAVTQLHTAELAALTTLNDWLSKQL
jgi:hypothetical protein